MKMKKKSSCIICFNCQDMKGTFESLQLFAYKFYQIDRACDININTCKTPTIICADDKTLLSMQNFYAKYDGNQPAIIVKKNKFDINDITSIDTKANFICDKLQDYKKSVWNEVLTFLGINNLNEKKERMVTEETNQNNEVINFQMQSFLIPRKEACEQFNELFDMDISVRVRSDLQNIIKQMESIVMDYKGDEKEDVN